MNNNYILYIAQEACFQTRSILIPFEEFISVRKEDYELLKRSSDHNVKFMLKDKEYIVDNLLTINYIFEGHSGRAESCEHLALCTDLAWYADCWRSDMYIDIKDQVWFDKSICNIASGFNDIENYIICKNMSEYKGTPINIVDSFLCLELENGRFRISPFDTVDELMTWYAMRNITSTPDTLTSDSSTPDSSRIL